jgi:hypothetical protein
MNKNYSAWDVNINDFYNQKTDPDQIKFLLNFAILAPSSHNTQPWSFGLSENNISIYKDENRRLPIADTNDRQLFLSLGCTIENILIAADYYGYLSEIEYIDKNTQENLVAVISLTKKEYNHRSDDSHLIHFISKRKTNRGKYKETYIETNALKEILSLRTENTDINIIDHKEKISTLAKVATSASIESMNDEEFRRELSKYIRPNITKSKIGMPGFTLGIPTLISFVFPFLIRRFNMEKMGEKQNTKLFENFTPYIAVITTKNDVKADWINAGRIFQHMALVATKYGVSVSPWGAPIQIGQYYKKIQMILNTSNRPQMFFRMGYPIKNVMNSPRLNLVDAIKK